MLFFNDTWQKAQGPKARVTVHLSGFLQGSAPLIEGEVPKVPGLSSPVTEERPDFPDLEFASAFGMDVALQDPANQQRTIKLYYFHTADQRYDVRAYLADKERDGQPLPAILTDASGKESILLDFDAQGPRKNQSAAGTPDLILSVRWPGIEQPDTLALIFDKITLDPTASNVEVKIGDL